MYDILHSFLPSLSKTQIKEETMSQRAEFEYDIRHVENIEKILDSNFKVKIPVVIGGDVASVKQVFESSLNSIYLYMILPLLKEFKPFARIETHDIECFLGKMKLLSYFNHTFENAIT